MAISRDVLGAPADEVVVQAVAGALTTGWGRMCERLTRMQKVKGSSRRESPVVQRGGRGTRDPTDRIFRLRYLFVTRKTER